MERAATEIKIQTKKFEHFYDRYNNHLDSLEVSFTAVFFKSTFSINLNCLHRLSWSFFNALISKLGNWRSSRKLWIKMVSSHRSKIHVVLLINILYTLCMLELKQGKMWVGYQFHYLVVCVDIPYSGYFRGTKFLWFLWSRSQPRKYCPRNFEVQSVTIVEPSLDHEIFTTKLQTSNNFSIHENFPPQNIPAIQ